MATQRDPELTFFHGHTRSTAACGTGPSEKDLKVKLNSSFTSANEKRAALRWGVGAETESHCKPHPQHGSLASGWNAQTQTFSGE